MACELSSDQVRVQLWPILGVLQELYRDVRSYFFLISPFLRICYALTGMRRGGGVNVTYVNPSYSNTASQPVEEFSQVPRRCAKHGVVNILFLLTEGSWSPCGNNLALRKCKLVV